MRRLPPLATMPTELGLGDIFVPPFDRARTAAALSRFGQVQVVQALAVGIDSLLPILPAGTTLCNAAGAHTLPVAEWVIGAAIALQRDFPGHLARQQREEWAGLGLDDGTPELHGSCALVVGAGAIGRMAARRLRALDVRVEVVSRRSRSGVHGLEELDALAAIADLVVLLLPLTPRTRGLIGRSFLERLRPGAIVINAGRGAVVDTEALVDRLVRGQLRAALDVTDPEPLPPGHPLWHCPGVLITPHIAGRTAESTARLWRLVREQTDRYVHGRRLLNVVARG